MTSQNKTDDKIEYLDFVRVVIHCPLSIGNIIVSFNPGEVYHKGMESILWTMDQMVQVKISPTIPVERMQIP